MKESPCPFCNVDPTRVILENKHAIAIEDGFPVAKGHVLVVPRAHLPSIYDLDREGQESIWELVRRVREILQEQRNPDGFNIGINDGEAAGQTIMHAHVHVIPRRDGDVRDPRGGIRWVLPGKAVYWDKEGTK